MRVCVLARIRAPRACVCVCVRGEARGSKPPLPAVPLPVRSSAGAGTQDWPPGLLASSERALLCSTWMGCTPPISPPYLALTRAGKVKGEVVEAACVIELPFLNGRAKITGTPLFVLVEKEGA